MISDVRQKRPIMAVWITDGARSANPVRRERESRSVMKLVGVPEANLHFLGFPDQRSFRSLQAIHQQLLLIAKTNAFVEILSPPTKAGTSIMMWLHF
jgi:LmbE family N-acetylglucosaminyl deacetylase